MSIVKRVCNVFKTTKISPEANPNLIPDELFDNINYNYENKLQKKIRSDTFEKLNASFRINIENFVYNYMNLIKFYIGDETFMLITQTLTDKKFAALDYTSFLDYFYYNCKSPITVVSDKPEYKRYREYRELTRITNNDCNYSVAIPNDIDYIHKIYLPKSATNVRIKMNDVEYPITICKQIRGLQFMGFVEYSVNIPKYCIQYSESFINFTDIKTPQIYIVQTILPYSMIEKFLKLTARCMFKFEDNVIVGYAGATKNYSGSHELKKIIMKKEREIDEYMIKNREFLREYESYYKDYKDYYEFPEK